MNSMNTNHSPATNLPGIVSFPMSGGRSRHSRPGLTIRVTTHENPKKRRAAERFSKYRDGMDPREYAEAIGGDAVQAYRDIVWDYENGYIDLVKKGS